MENQMKFNSGKKEISNFVGRKKSGESTVLLLFLSLTHLSHVFLSGACVQLSTIFRTLFSGFFSNRNFRARTCLLIRLLNIAWSESRFWAMLNRKLSSWYWGHECPFALQRISIFPLPPRFFETFIRLIFYSKSTWNSPEANENKLCQCYL